MRRYPYFSVVVFSMILLLSFSCQKAYYGTMEKLGYHKRDILAKRVKEARDEQGEAKEQFKSAFDQFKTEIGFEGGDLENRYQSMKKEYEGCLDRSKAVNDKVESVEKVAKDLFIEWEKELAQYTSQRLREESQLKYNTTEKQYKQLIIAMKSAASKMDPVIYAFKDQVLYLKHNLNAQAIASLKNELVRVETDVATLIEEMEMAIQNADRFISAMEE